MIPRLSQFLRQQMPGSLKVFVRGDNVRDFVFEEKCVTVPTVSIDIDQTFIRNIVQEVNSNQDNVEELVIQNQEIITEEQTLQPQEPIIIKEIH